MVLLGAFRLLLCACVVVQSADVSLHARDNEYSFLPPDIQINNFQPNTNRQIQNLNLEQIVRPTFELSDFLAPDLNINNQTLRLPEMKVRDLDNSVWTYKNEGYHFDGDQKRFDSYSATIHPSDASQSVAMSLGNMKFETGHLAPQSYTRAYKDELGNSLTIERTNQIAEPNPAYQQFVTHFEQAGPSAARPIDPSRELVTAYNECSTMPGKRTQLHIDSIDHDSNLHRFVSGYHGTVQDEKQTLTFTVTAVHNIDGKIESLNFNITAKGAPTAHISWKPTDAQDTTKGFALLRDNLPIPVLIGPRSSFRFNNVDIPEAPLKLSPDGNIATKQIGDVKDIANLLGKEHVGIQVSFSPPATDSPKSGFSLMNSLRNLGYMLIGKWAEVKDMRQQLTRMQATEPGKFVLVAGFGEPGLMSLKDMRAVLGKENNSATTAIFQNKKQDGYIGIILSVIKVPLKLAGEVIGTALSLPGVKQVWTVTRVIAGAAIGVLTGDLFNHSNPIQFDPNGIALVTINGIKTPRNKAIELNNAGKSAFGIKSATMIMNDTHWFGIGDFIQILSQEYLGAIDKPSLDTATAIRAGIKERGEVFVLAHSQGSSIFKQSLALLTTEEKSKIHYIGVGPEWIIDAKTEGLATSTNILNKGDPVPTLGNKLKLITNLIFPWNWGRLSVRDVTTQDIGVKGLAAHGFENYVKAVDEWAKKWKEHSTYSALQLSY